MKRIFTAWIVAILVFAGLTLATTPSPPTVAATTAPAGCIVGGLNVLSRWYSAAPPGTVITLPPGSCFTGELTLHNTTNLTINANGVTFEETTCDTNPIVDLYANTNLVINGANIEGPCQGGGAGSEGGYGILMGGEGYPVGNAGVTLSGLTISGVAGDGLAILPDLSNCCGINTNVTVEGSTFDNIGYHVVTLEGVNGFNFHDNTVSHSGNFLDMELDVDCGGCSETAPTGAAEQNVTINHNTFKASGTGDVWISELQGACVPMNNLAITNNTLDSSVNPAIELQGGSDPSCHDQNVTISRNTATYPAHSPCGGSIADTPPDCAVWEISDADHVNIVLNNLNVYDGDASWGPNTLFVPCVALAGVNTALVAGNYCHDAWNVVTLGGWGMQFNPQDLAVIGLTHCWNTWGLTDPVDGATANVQHEASC